MASNLRPREVNVGPRSHNKRVVVVPGYLSVRLGTTICDRALQMCGISKKLPNIQLCSSALSLPSTHLQLVLIPACLA